MDPQTLIAEFEQAVKSAPDRAFSLWALANFYEDRQDWDQAEALYRRALDLEPDDVVANMNFARMLKRKGALGDARQYAERALYLDPDYGAAKSLLSELKGL